MKKLSFLLALFGFLSVVHADVDPVIREKVEAVLVPGTHVASFEHAGQTYWAKRTEKSKTKKSNCVKYVLSHLIPYRVLRPTYYCGDNAAIHKELERMQTLSDAGVHVPQIIAAEDNWMVLSDMGSGLEHALHQGNDHERLALLKQAAAEIGHIHNRGQWHGRAHIKDITYKDGVIGFIDFEEDPSNQLSVCECQARDILVFSYSILHLIDNDSGRLEDILHAYKETAPAEAWQKLLQTADDLSPVLAVATPFADIAGRDIRRAVATKRAFDEILVHEHYYD